MDEFANSKVLILYIRFSEFVQEERLGTIDKGKFKKKRIIKKTTKKPLGCEEQELKIKRGAGEGYFYMRTPALSDARKGWGYSNFCLEVGFIMHIHIAQVLPL